jgi:hypothetical protein
MSSSEPSKWTTALGASADVNVIPATTPAGTGLASMASIFPAITQVPIDSGGIAPERADFNALFKMLGDQSYFLQQGGVYSYSASYAYRAGDLVMYNGNLYRCIQAHAAGAAAPSNTSYWSAIASAGDIPTKTSQLRNDSGFVTSASVPTKTSQLQNDSGFITSESLPTVNNGTLTIQQDGVTVGTFTANQSGNTTVNVTGGGGGGSGPQIFFAVADSTQDAAIRAAGFWRCGRGYAFWDASDTGSAGGRWYICYAPNGHTITEVDLRWSYSQYVVVASSSTSLPHGGTCVAWTAPTVSGTSSPQTGVDIPTVGMTSASEVAFPANPYVPN